MNLPLCTSGGDVDSAPREGSDEEGFLDAYGNVIDPSEAAPPAKQPNASTKQAAASSADSDTESNVSKDSAATQKDGKKKKKQGNVQQLSSQIAIQYTRDRLLGSHLSQRKPTQYPKIPYKQYCL